MTVQFEGHDFPVVQYADDTLLFLEASFAYLEVLKNALGSFEKATGLKVSFLVAINVDDYHATAL
jgi:hypothetical protein